MMVTTNEGALAIETVCEKVESANGDVMLYWFNESQTMNQAFAKSPELSFAFPLNNGKFKIINQYTSNQIWFKLYVV